MEKIWLKSYPKGVGPEISVDQYNSVVDVLTETCKKYGSDKAFSNMGTSITFSQFNSLSDDFASYLQNHTNAKLTVIPDSLYKFNFLSPTWSPDMAGWSMVVAIFFGLSFLKVLIIDVMFRKKSI